MRTRIGTARERRDIRKADQTGAGERIESMRIIGELEWAMNHFGQEIAIVDSSSRLSFEQVREAIDATKKFLGALRPNAVPDTLDEAVRSSSQAHASA